jgi:putative acetyltransferase
MTNIRIIDLPWEHPDGRKLRDAQRAEIAVRYNSHNSEPGTPPTEADIAFFIVAYIYDQPVACGALRALHVDPVTGQSPPGDAEVKRMFVLKESRGQGGIASMVLQALEERARSKGWKRLVLECGNHQPDAIRFYTKAGYVSIPKFGPYAGSEISLCFGRTI